MQHDNKIMTWAATKIMGHKHWCRNWLAALLAADAELLEHILEQDSGYLHYLCLISMNNNRLSYSNHEDLADMIRRTPKKQMLEAVLESCPDGLLGALKNLYKRPISRSSYTRLIKLMGDSRARKFLLHRKKISSVQLNLMEKLSPKLRDCHAIKHIHHKRDTKDFLEMIDKVHRLAPAVSYADIALSLSHVPVSAQHTRSRYFSRYFSRHFSFLYNNSFHSWYERQISKKNFPDPPWSGNDWIKPITNGEQLRHVGHAMRNCIASGLYREEILKGNAYFYVTNRKPEVVIRLEKDDDKWYLEKAEGKKSKCLSKKSMEQIVCALQKAGFGALQCEEDTPEIDFPGDYGLLNLPDNYSSNDKP